MNLRYAVYDTPCGNVTLIAKEKALCRLIYGVYDPFNAINEENTSLFDGIMELNQYFFGQRRNFDVKIDPDGTPFEKKVWEYVLSIPYGHTKTYEEVAIAIGEPQASRAISNALARNPLPLFIPCHRVIGKDNDFGSYIGGVELKKKLLALESATLAKEFRPGSFSSLGAEN